MQIENVVEAINEARRFVGKAKKVLKGMENSKYFWGKEVAACRRSSMDLTRALSEMRK